MSIRINRAPVLTLWASIVAERLGFDHDEALTLGRALAGLTAHAKGVRLGIFEPTSGEEIQRRRQEVGQDEQVYVRLMGREIALARTAEGFRAIEKGKSTKPAAVTSYLASKFGDDLAAVREAMVTLAEKLSPPDLHHRAFGLYERFRPSVPDGEQGWGAKGLLDLEAIVAAADR